MNNKDWQRLINEAYKKPPTVKYPEDGILVLAGVISAILCIALFFAFFLVKGYG